MFRKYILILSAFFGLSMIAETYADMSGEEASGFSGAFELKYNANLGDEGDIKLGDFTYRARAGWAGEVNSMVMWRVGLSSDIETSFKDSLGLNSIHLEQAYVTYMPLDGLKVRAGKFGWGSNFSRTGVLYDDDLYFSGASAKYHNEMFYVKAALVYLDEDFKGPFSAAGNVVGVKVGAKHDMGDVQASGHVGVKTDMLSNDDEDSRKNLLNAGVKVDVRSMMVPVSVVGIYGTDSDFNTDAHSYNAGIYVNEGDDMFNLAVGVHYFNLNAATWNMRLVDTDYIESSAENAEGVAVKAAVNLWENSDLAVKYTYRLEDGVSDPNSLIAELTFNF